VEGTPYYAAEGQGSLVPKSETGWFQWLRRFFGFGKVNVPTAENPEHAPNPAPTNPSGGRQHSARAAVSEFGDSFIGVVEIGPQGPRVTAGTYAKNANHLSLSKRNLGPLQANQRRFGFTRNRGGITIGPSSTGAIPTVDEIPAIRAALQQQDYLTLAGLYLIVAEDSIGEQHVFNLLTEEMIK
jgi:hypothetical protein